MRSSISNSEVFTSPTRVDWVEHLKSLLVAVTCLAMFDVGVRVLPPRTVGDHAQVRSFPARAEILHRAPGRHAILMGNSLTRNGYDLATFDAAVKASGEGPFTADVIALYGSSLTEWFHIFKRDFVDAGIPPDVVVINMSPGAAEDELPENIRVSWLPEESRTGDAPEILQQDLPLFEQQAEFVHAWTSEGFAYRADLRADILYRLVPEFWYGMQWVNTALDRDRPAGGGVRHVPVYAKAKRLMALAKANGVRVVWVAMPLRPDMHHIIDPDLLKVVAEAGMSFMDCRQVPGLDASKFKDHWHMNEDGGRVFSRYMGRALPKYVDEVLGAKMVPYAAR